MAEQDAGAQALEQGVLGTVHDEIENDAYTVSGQGPETAKREREQRDALRTKFQDASRHEEASEAQPRTTRRSKSSSSTSAESGSESS